MNDLRLPQEFLAGIRRLMALLLWDVGAVKVNVQQPFRLVSGLLSPIYIDCRLLLSSKLFPDFLVSAVRILQTFHGVRFDVVAGGETAGIPLAAFVARSLNYPMVYVRKQRKDHGRQSAVEGHLSQGNRVLLVEDLVTDGHSKRGFIEGLREAGAEVDDALVVFDRLQGGHEVLNSLGVTLHALCDIEELLRVGESCGVLDPLQNTHVRAYLEDPHGWQKHGVVAP